MASGRTFGSYSEFVRCVLAAVRPLLPPSEDEKVGFGGYESFWGRPSVDSAVIKGRRAVFLSMLAIEAEEITGVDSACYQLELSMTKVNWILSHSAYAKNLRRWQDGQLPRKKKARSDFVLVASCWLLGWGNKTVAASETATNAREEILSWASGESGFACGDALSVVSALWKASCDSYKTSMAKRRVKRL